MPKTLTKTRGAGHEELVRRTQRSFETGSLIVADQRTPVFASSDPTQEDKIGWMTDGEIAMIASPAVKYDIYFRVVTHCGVGYVINEDFLEIEKSDGIFST